MFFTWKLSIFLFLNILGPKYQSAIRGQRFYLFLSQVRCPRTIPVSVRSGWHLPVPLRPEWVQTQWHWDAPSVHLGIPLWAEESTRSCTLDLLATAWTPVVRSEEQIWSIRAGLTIRYPPASTAYRICAPYYPLSNFWSSLLPPSYVPLPTALFSQINSVPFFPMGASFATSLPK